VVATPTETTSAGTETEQTLAGTASKAKTEADSAAEGRPTEHTNTGTYEADSASAKTTHATPSPAADPTEQTPKSPDPVMTPPKHRESVQSSSSSFSSA
jgi:hypothetical protein